MRCLRLAAASAAVLIGLGACGHDPAPPSVPRLSGGTGTGATPSSDTDQNNPNAAGGDGSAARRARLHTAADCIRQHGAAGYQDPVLTPDGYVYTDDVALRGLDGPQLDTITNACQSLIHAANFSVRDQGPPPPRLIQAGVESAKCMRAHGLPDYRDPTVDSPFSPGKGFGITLEHIPPGGKQNPTLRGALAACRTVLDREAELSSLGNLGNA